MNIKGKKTKKQVNEQKSVVNILSKDEISKKIEAVEKDLKASTWRELETNGKFAKNDKLSFISEDLPIALHFTESKPDKGMEPVNDLCQGISLFTRRSLCLPYPYLFVLKRKRGFFQLPDFPAGIDVKAGHQFHAGDSDSC